MVVLPFLWRLLQCGRVYRETKSKFHIYNAIKYVLNFSVYFLSYFHGNLLCKYFYLSLIFIYFYLFLFFNTKKIILNGLYCALCGLYYLLYRPCMHVYGIFIWTGDWGEETVDTTSCERTCSICPTFG